MDTKYTREEYKELKKKWNNGITIDEETTKEEVKEYIDWKYYEYGTATDSDLWECFQADFGESSPFTAEIINILSVRVLQKLKNYLLSRGVYVAPNNKKVILAASLYQCAREEDQHQWTKEEVQYVQKKKHINIVSETLLELVSDTPIPTNKPTPTVPDLRQSPQVQYPQLPQYETPINQVPQNPTAALPQTPPVTLPQTPPVASLQNPPVTLRQNSPFASEDMLQTLRPAAQGHGRELANLAKLYADELKYSGMDESLNHKLTIFYDMCNRADVPPDAYLKAFPTMLTDMALTHFYDINASQICNYNFGKVIEHIQKFFEGLGFQRKNLNE